MRASAVLLVLASLALAGCAEQLPPTASPGASLSVPAPSPSPIQDPSPSPDLSPAASPSVGPSPTPTAPTLPTSPVPLRPPPERRFEERFGAHPTEEGPWRIATWNDGRDIGGRLTWTDGALRLRAVRPAPEEGYGAGPVLALARDVEAPPQGTAMEATVTVHKLFRYGIVLSTGDVWAALEIDSIGVCLCAEKAEGWVVDPFAPPPAEGDTVRIRLELIPDGVARGLLLDAEGRVLAEHRVTGVLARPEDVRTAYFGVWTDEAADVASDYTTHRVALAPLD